MSSHLRAYYLENANWAKCELLPTTTTNNSNNDDDDDDERDSNRTKKVFTKRYRIHYSDRPETW